MDARVLGVGLRLLRAVSPIDLHDHAGPTGAQPDIADDDSLERDRVRRPAHGQRMAFGAGRHRFQGGMPATVGVRPGRKLLAAEARVHHLARVGEPPYRDRFAALQHHVIREELRQGHVG